MKTEDNYLERMLRPMESKNNAYKIASICLKFALEQNKKGNSAFFDFAGHVNMISLGIHKGKWNEKSNTEPFVKLYFFDWSEISEVMQLLSESKTKLK